MDFFSQMNSIEWCCGVLGALVAALFLAWRKERPAPLLISAAAVLPASLLSMAAATQVLTCDDSYLFWNIVNFRDHAEPYVFHFRTTIGLFSPMLAGIGACFGMAKDLLLVLAKTGHWFMGVFLATLLADQLHRWYAPRVRRTLFYAVSINCLLLLPVVDLALKTLNYDLLSMELGVLALLWLGASLRSGRRVLLLGSVVCATLAAQEKMSAAPLLFLCLFLASARLAWPWRNARTLALMDRSVRAAAMTAGVSVCIVLVFYWLLIFSRGVTLKVLSTYEVLYPFLSATWPIARFFSDAPEKAALYCRIYGTGIGGVAVAASAIIALTALFSAIACRFGPGLLALARRALARCDIVRVALFVKIILLCAGAVTGIAATYLLHARVWPLMPCAPGEFVPHVEWNGIAMIFGAHSAAGHAAASVAWAYAAFFNSLPTVLVIALIAAAIPRMRSGAREGDALWSTVVRDCLAIASLAGPALYGLMQVPVYPRYLNLFLLGAVLFSLPDIFIVNLRTRFAAMAGAAVFCVLIFAEVLPFYPVDVGFRPVWSNYSKEFSTNPAYGLSTPWYAGWGEEVFECAKRIEKIAAASCGRADTLRILHNYPGGWIRPPKGVELIFMDHTFSDYTYGPCDYYVLTRKGVTFSPHGFPETSRPLFTLSERGLVKAWVFRGSDLAGDGFTFGK